MSHVVTLAAASSSGALTDAVVATVRQALPAAGMPRRFTDAAADIEFSPPATALADLRQRLITLLQSLPIDAIVQPVASRRKRLFLADMDSTMIGQECIDELADYVGMKAEVSRITEQAMRGELAFEPALRKRVALLAGLPASIVDEIIRERIVPTPGGAAFLAAFAAAGGRAILVSGGFTLFTGRIAAALGFADHRANRLEIGPDDRLTGRVIEPILGRAAKQATLIAERTRLGLAPHETLAIGDGANDLDMLGEAGLGIAFRAKPAVAAAAHARLDHADLSALIAVVGLAGT